MGLVVAVGADARRPPILLRMCRNITELRGLEPAATDEEVEAAARQYVRKVSGITRPTAANAEALPPLKYSHHGDTTSDR